MHPDQRALLSGIIADPNDDHRRRVYTDWLEENTSDRDELDWVRLMRLQIEFAAEKRKTYRVRAAARQIKDLMGGCTTMRWYHAINQVLDSWMFGFTFDGWDYTVVPSCPSVKFTRGFISQVTCTMAKWEQHGPAICDVHPVERVTITDKEPAERNGLFMWANDPTPPSGMFGWEVPDSIADKSGRYCWIPFKSADEAKDWFSSRCIAWARAKANQSSDQWSTDR